MAKKRLFIAADISDEQRQAVARLSSNLAKGVRFTRSHPKWVEPENMHLTIKFLGGVEENRIDAIRKTVAPAVAGLPPIFLDLEGLGVFPNPHAPKVLWIGVDHGRKQLGAVAQAVDGALARIGFPRERRAFHPHLTLARVTAIRGANELMNVVESHKRAQLPPATIGEIALYESELLPEGAKYTALHRWPLAPSKESDPA